MRKTKFLPGHIYHVYNRGNRKNALFLSSKDYLRLIRTIRKYSVLLRIEILAFCLMPNHFHLLVKQLGKRNISIYMHRVGISYSMYLNKRYNLVGHSFQGKFQAKVVLGIENVLRVVDYISENPVKDGLSLRGSDYRWLWVGDIQDSV